MAIRHDLGWTAILLAYLILIGIAFCILQPALMRGPWEPAAGDFASAFGSGDLLGEFGAENAAKTKV